MDRSVRKPAMWIAMLLMVAITLSGCKNESEQCTAPSESPEWETVSTSVEDYNISVDYGTNLQVLSLDQLIAVSISGDETVAEACGDELYQRFAQYPFTVCRYIALIQDELERERICTAISVAAVCWHGSEERILEIVNEMKTYMLPTDEAQVVSLMERRYYFILEGNK